MCSFTIISFATSVKCYSEELVSVDSSDVIVEWLKRTKPSGCSNILGAIKVMLLME